MYSIRSVRNSCRIAFFVGGLLAASSQAQPAFPSQPVRLVTWSAAGSSIDIFTRLVADQLQRDWGQSVVVENKLGAGGIIASESVARARPDGYTILITATTAQIHNTLLKAKLPYDPIKDFDPISLLARGRHAFVVPASAPYNTLQEFVTHAKKTRGGLSFGSWGQGSAGHLMGAYLARQANMTLIHVAYKSGDVAAITDLVGGVLDAAFVAQGSARVYSRSGKIKVLAVAGDGRTKSMPSIPTFAESGFKGFEVSGWIAALVPAKTPQVVAQKIETSMRRVMQMPAVVARSEELELEAVGSTPQELLDTEKADLAMWSKMVEASGLQRE